MKLPVLILLALITLFPVSAFALQPAEITVDSVLASMNDYRAEAGLAPLSIEARLTLAADDRMRDMEELAYWSHEAPDGRSPFLWLHSRGYLYSFAGEILAAGFETTPVLVSSWMESPGHRANIMSRDYEHCGIAIIDGSTKGPATGKSIVVLFGSNRRAIPTQKTAKNDD
jgi:uncharacterized protein YkwD